MKQALFNRKLAPTNPTALHAQSAQAPGNETRPVGKWRMAVRGLARSNSRSTIRLNVMAQVRAQTIASRIRPKTRQPGQPFCSRAATTIDARANGNAKSVWENL